jgi:predicted GIY-YIG superfamily endonuclease/proteasome lid subunit RPN8/RPN11
MPFWTYILHCRDGVFYTGHTDDLDARIAAHTSGTLKGWTSDYLPVELVWSQEFSERSEALEAERRIKGWSRKKKLALIRGDWDAVSFHAKSKGGPSTSSGRTGLWVKDQVLIQLRREAKLAHRNECCGILLGDANNITQITPAKNVHPTPQSHFEIDPAALIAAHKAERSGGPQIIGYYHSHPTGSPEPSPTDQAMAARDGKIWAIIGHSEAEQEIKFWRDDPEGFTSLSYSLVEA